MKRELDLIPIEFAPHDKPILAYFPLHKSSHQWAVVSWNEEASLWFTVHGGGFIGHPESFKSL
jgi:hypothetical protein